MLMEKTGNEIIIIAVCLHERQCHTAQLFDDSRKLFHTVAGRYDYGDEPDDVYRRHDNCGCSVTYENGRQRTFAFGKLRSFAKRNVRQDVWSKREWEAPEADAGAGEPVVFTKEQAAALQEKHGLTKLSRSDTINERSQLKHSNNDLSPFGSKSKTGSEFWPDEAKLNLYRMEKEISGGRTEIAVLFKSDGSEAFQKNGDASSVTFSKSERKKMVGCVLTHNHPNNTPFSHNDISFLLDNGLDEIRAVVDGGTYILQRTWHTVKNPPDLKTIKEEYYRLSNEIGGKYHEISAKEGRPFGKYLIRIEEDTVMALSKKYGLNFVLEVD